MTTDNIYRAPTADLNEAPNPRGDDIAAATKFYVVAPFKFVLLFICTLGFFKYYWFYKNWSRYKAYVKDDMWPVMRGIFTIFFVHSLFRSVDETITAQSREYSWVSGRLATLFVIFQLIINGIGRLPKMGFDNIALGVELVLMLPVMGIILYSAQCAINVACGDPKGESNSRLSVINWLWIVIGGCFLAMAIAGAALN